MSAAALEPRSWARRFWWWMVVLVCAVQVALIFWLSDYSPPGQRTVIAAPALSLAGPAMSRFLALNDPTLFARPHEQGFSGGAWMTLEPQEFQSFLWSNAPSLLDLPNEELGATFHRFALTHAFNALQLLTQVAPEPTFPAVVPAKLFPERSALQVVGALASRALASPLELPSWPNPELLTNSVVQALVDAEGTPVSVTLLLPGSGSREADQKALALARTARFAPLPRRLTSRDEADPGDLTWGNLIFAWHTIPLPGTNGPNRSSN